MTSVESHERIMTSSKEVRYMLTDATDVSYYTVNQSRGMGKDTKVSV